jgi:hypothetical protein
MAAMARATGAGACAGVGATALTAESVRGWGSTAAMVTLLRASGASAIFGALR